MKKLITNTSTLTILLLGGLLSVGTASAAVGDLAEGWSDSYDNSNSGLSLYDEAVDVAVDAAGNTYVTGRSRNIDPISLDGDYDFATIKYDSTGSRLWVKRYDSGAGDEPVAITVDTSGNVYVTGRTYTAGQYDYITIKYDSSGSVVSGWPQSYDNAGNDDEPVAIAVDSSGNVIVTGTSGNGSNTDYATIKYNSSGAVVSGWPQRYDDGDNDEAVGVGVDGSGNVYVTGRSDHASTDITTIKYNSAGVEQWTAGYVNVIDNLPDTNSYPDTNDYPVDLVIDAGGNVYITGRTFSASVGNNNIITLKYDTNGTQLWAASYDGGSQDISAGIATDGSGNVYVTGKSGVPFAYDYITIKYNSDGTIAWATPYDSGANDEAVDLGVGDDGTVYVTGLSSNGAGNDIVTLRYDSAGIEKQVLSKDNGGNDTPAALALGASGISVTGASFNGSNNDFLTVMYVTIYPDLTVTTVSGPATVANDSIVNVDNTIENILDPASGRNADVGSFDVDLYLAPDDDGLPDMGNLIPLGSRNISGLAKGDSDAASTSVTIPSTGTAPPGNYYFVAIADSGEDVTEKDEANNTGVSGVIAVVNAPDLVATSVSGPTSAPAGSTINVNYTINNPRTVAAGSFDVTFVLSDDTTIGNGDDRVFDGGSGTITIGGLAGNSSVSDSASVTIPNDAPEGFYYIGMTVDSGSVILETDETNNVVTSTGTTEVTGISDLLLTEISGPYGATQGETVSVTNTVLNAGAALSTSFMVGIYLSTDSTITTADTLIGTRTITSIGSGATDTDNTLAEIPSSIASGGYYLGAIVDYDPAPNGVIIENNESNNTLDGWALSVDVGFDGGDSTDGAATIAGTVNLTTGNAGADSDDNGSQPDAYATRLSANASQGGTSLTVVSTAGFVTGDEILVVQVIHNSNHGFYEFHKNITVVNGTTLSLDEGLLNNYFATGNTSQGTPNTTQVVRVPHYSSLNVPGGTTLTAGTFNSSSRLGGILVFRADSITVDGTINGNGLGFPGGVTNTSGFGVHLGTQGWSYTGQGLEATTTRNAGGGSGGPRDGPRRIGGAGGGYGTNGIRGQGPDGTFGGQGGLAHGNPQLTRIYMGSGGGSGSQSTGTVGVGGKGGGLVYIGTNSANVSGIISANGQNGGNSSGFSVAGSGGGSGSSLYLSAASKTITGSVTASGGTGGTTDSSNGGPGGNGGSGRIYQPSTGTDLTITAITGPASAARGDTISVSTTVANVQAVATATTFKVGIYLSTDSTITTADTKIGECTLTGLAGNTSSALTTGSSPECGNAVVPSDLYTGGGPLTYYLGAIADYEGVVPELTEINNAMVQTGVSGPEGTSVSVLTNSLNASTDNSGGGTFGLIELLLGLGGLGMALHRRR